MRIGFIGLGNMGSAMAANLLKAGHEVTVYNRSGSKVDALAAEGARPAGSIAEACHGDVVVTMLANDEAVAGTVFGDGGIVASLAQGATHVSSSTISVALSERLTAAHAEAGQQFVAAPVFGRPEAAQAAGLFVVAAGPPASLQALSGIVDKAGVDKHQYLDILTSTLFDAPIYKTYGELIAGERFEPAGFAASLGQKDIRLVLTAAEELQVPMPVASLVRDRFLALLARGGAHLVWSAVGALAAWEAGAAGPTGR